MSNVTRILSQIGQGDPTATDTLLPMIYDDLRKLAAAKLGREKPGQTLQATALVHEAYVRFVGHNHDQPWNSRGHFFGAAAEAMRRILVEQSRRKQSIKAGGELERQELPEIEAPMGAPAIDLLALDEALKKLEARDTRQAELIKLRFFTGLTIEQAAEALGVSTSTAENDWAYARCWLRLELEDND